MGARKKEESGKDIAVEYFILLIFVPFCLKEMCVCVCVYGTRGE